PGTADPDHDVDPRRFALRNVRTEHVGNFGRLLIGDQPERDLGVRFAWHDLLAAWAGIAAPHPVDLRGRAGPDPLERGVAGLARRRAAVAGGAEPCLLVVREAGGRVGPGRAAPAP